ncbi:MAG: hypothetical protein WAN16_02885, partial [Chthoniobacterales bacterium]
NGRALQNAKVTKCRGVREEKLESNDFLHFVLFVCFVVPLVFNPDPPAKFLPFLFCLLGRCFASVAS